jgi:hypothetical protein
MVVDPDPPAKRLPFELEIHILGTTVRSLTSTSKMEAYVDTYFDDALHSTTFISLKQGNTTTTGGALGGGGVGGSSAATTCSTTVIRPLHNLDPNMKISFVVHKQRQSSANQSSAGRVDMLLGHIIDDKDKGPIDHEYPIQNTTNRYLQLSIELKEQKLFCIEKVNPLLLRRYNDVNSMDTVVVLSPRLKDKIIILSLAIGSNCTGLLDEIVGFLTESVNYITELDLFDIIDDINQMYKKSEFSKLITLLQDSDHPLKSVTPYLIYHSEWCVYTKLVSLPPPALLEGEGGGGGAGGSGSASSKEAAAAALLGSPGRRSSVRHAAVQKTAFRLRSEEIAAANAATLRLQPCMSRDLTPGLLKVPTDTPEVANVAPGLHGYSLTLCCSEQASYGLVWGNFYEYIQVQKIISILKYQPDEVNSGRLDASWQVLYYPPHPEGGTCDVSVPATLKLDSDSQCFQISMQQQGQQQGGGGAGREPPVVIGFEEVHPQ